LNQRAEELTTGGLGSLVANEGVKNSIESLAAEEDISD